MAEEKQQDHLQNAANEVMAQFDDVREDVTGVAKTLLSSAEIRWSVSCYIPVFNIVTCALCAVKMVESKFCRFHSRQGLALFALWFFTILVGLISPILSLMLWGVVLVLHIAGMVIAYAKKITKIPLLGNFADKIPEYYIFTLLTGKTPDKIQ